MVLQCNECGHEEKGSASGMLMNKIKMWNHLKNEHPMLAERIMKTHEVMPTSFYTQVRARTASMPMSDVRPRWSPI
jgi:hypothetical protein